MHFILISKKADFQENHINENFLKSAYAPSIISRESVKLEISNFIIYIYPYDHIIPESYSYSYHVDKDNLFLCNGLVNINRAMRNQDICKLFEEVNESADLHGDYQLISINKNGNGFLKTPPLSLRQLFYYEDENCQVLATEIKLIVDGIQKFREKTFVHHFDIDFMEDSIFREWSTRKVPQKTIFKDIERIFPNDLIQFSAGKINIERKDSIKVPEWFKDEYNNNKEKLYNEYFEMLMEFVESNLLNIKPHIEKVTLGLTGGFDSRLTAAILSGICKKNGIPFECHTSGQSNHPDVVIAKKVAKVLDIPHFHHLLENNKRPNTKTYNDYILTFYISQGDFNSKDFVPSYNRKITNPAVLAQLGMDAFKRYTMDKIYSGNRWFARRILFHKNFFFPLFYTKYETWLAIIYGENGDEYFKEYIYEILKRSEPELLEIPFAGDSLPQVNIKPYLTKGDTTYHEKEPFLWDYPYVRNNLKMILNRKFEEFGPKSRLFLKFLGFNELDYFLNTKIKTIINLYREKKIGFTECVEDLVRERFTNRYPKNKTLMTMSKNSDPYTTKLQILMDFAVVADKKSFEELEKYMDLEEN